MHILRDILVSDLGILEEAACMVVNDINSQPTYWFLNAIYRQVFGFSPMRYCNRLAEICFGTPVAVAGPGGGGGIPHRRVP